MNTIYSGNEAYHDIRYTEILEDICDEIQTHPHVNRRAACYKIHDVLRNDNRNGRERQKPREEWVKFYTRYLRLL